MPADRALPNVSVCGRSAGKQVGDDCSMSQSIQMKFVGGPWDGTTRGVTVDDNGKPQDTVADEQHRVRYQFRFTSAAIGAEGTEYVNARYEYVGPEEWTFYGDGSFQRDQ